MKSWNNIKKIISKFQKLTQKILRTRVYFQLKNMKKTRFQKFIILILKKFEQLGLYL